MNDLNIAAITLDFIYWLIILPAIAYLQHRTRYNNGFQAGREHEYEAITERFTLTLKAEE